MVELYTNEDITGLAKVFTGLNLSVDYTLARADPDAPEVLASWREPMVFDPEYHSTAAKTFLGLIEPESGILLYTLLVYDHPIHEKHRTKNQSEQ